MTAKSSFEASTHITAEPAHVWDLLVRTEQWSAWDSNLERVDGSLGPSARVTIHVADQSRPFKLKVTTWDPGRRFVLQGGMPLGLFAAVRSFDLRPVDSGTRVTMTERYGGLLAAMIRRSIPDLQPSFDAFVAGLRAAAES